MTFKFMPTASKLVAALLMALLAWIVSDMIKPLMDEGTDFGKFNIINAGIGFFTGWMVIGRRTGRGWSAAIGVGLTAVVVLVFWGLFLQSVHEMYLDSLKRRFGDPMEAFIAIFDIMWEYVRIIATRQIVTVLAVAGVAIGLLAEWAAKTWR